MRFEIAKGRLKNALIMAGMTRSELANATNIYVPAIGRYASGAIMLDVEHLAQIADALGITPNYLMGEGPALDSQKVFKSVSGRIRKHASSWSMGQQADVTKKINEAIHGDCISISEADERSSVNRVVFSDRLHIALINSNLNIAEAANKMDVSGSAISRYLSRKRYPRDRFVIRLAEALGATTDFLTGRDLDLESLTAYHQVMRQIQSFAGFWTEEQRAELVREMQSAAVAA